MVVFDYDAIYRRHVAEAKKKRRRQMWLAGTWFVLYALFCAAVLYWFP